MTDFNYNGNHRSQVLGTADEIINGDRNQQYGDPNANFKQIAAMWNVLLMAEYERRTLEDPVNPSYVVETLVSPEMVGDMMIALKLSRNVHNRKLDNYVDIAGYAACAYHCTQV